MPPRGTPSSNDGSATAIAGTIRDIFVAVPRDARPLVALGLIAVGGVVALAWRLSAVETEARTDLYVIAAVVLVILAFLLFFMTMQIRKSAVALRQEEQQHWALSRDLSLAIVDGIEGNLTNWSRTQQADAWAALILSIEATTEDMAPREREVRADMAKRIKDRVGVLAYRYQKKEGAQALLDEISEIIEYRKSLKYD